MLPKDASTEIAESTEAADEGGSWDEFVMYSSLVSGVMSEHFVG